MGTTCRHTRILSARTLRAAMLAALGLWLFCAGGCAMLPFALTTAASVAMPQTASLAMTGVKGAYNTAVLASDERDINTILRDNMLSLKAKSALLTAHGSSDVQVYAYNGEVFAVGVVDTQADRDRVILAMQNVKGVGAIKGYIRLSDPHLPINHSADLTLESNARMALSRHLLHKNAGVEIQAVDGELCLMGVVGTHAEALDLIQYVESMSGARALSLLSIRNEYATGRAQTNRLYLLEPGENHARRGLSLLEDAQPLPRTPIRLAETASPAPTNAPAYAPTYAPARAAAIAPRLAPRTVAEARPAPVAPALNKARAFMQQRLFSLAKAEANPEARSELLTLAGQVAQDRDVSIADRLSVAADKATQQQAKVKIQALLAMY